MMNKRRYTKASDWIPVIEEWKQSGLSKKTFCSQKAIDYKLFYRWYSKLTYLEPGGVRGEKSPLLSDHFVPVEMIPPAKTMPTTTVCVLQLSSRLQLHIPRAAIDRDFLRTLLEAAEVKPC